MFAQIIARNIWSFIRSHYDKRFKTNMAVDNQKQNLMLTKNQLHMRAL